MFESRLEIAFAGFSHLRNLSARPRADLASRPPGVWHGGTGRAAPGPALVASIAAVDPARLSADAAIAWLGSVQRCQSWLAGLQSAGLVAIAGTVPRIDEFRARDRLVRIEDAEAEEIAAALRWSPRTARVRIDEARDLVGPLAPLHAALLAGDITPAHASSIARQVTNLPEVPSSRHVALLDSVVAFAITHTPAEAGRKAKGLVERVDPGEAERRRQLACTHVDVDVMDDLDGQSVLSARMATPDAHAILATIGALARNQHFSPDHACNAGQRRVEALKALVLGVSPLTAGADGGDPVASARATAHIAVVVSLETMLGLADLPAALEGSGTISAGAARDLIGSCGPIRRSTGSWSRPTALFWTSVVPGTR